MKFMSDEFLKEASESMESFGDKGMSRRAFMKFCTGMAALLALPASMVPQIAEAISSGKKPYLVWLEFQDCAGDTEALLRTTAGCRRHRP
jgi:hydrogenase small subunit